MQHGSVHTMSSSNKNVWFYSGTDIEERNPYEKIMMNKFERNNIDQTRPGMNSQSICNNMTICKEILIFKPHLIIKL